MLRFRAGTGASGPDVGPGKPESRPSGWPKAGRRVDFEFFLIRFRPKCGPETRFPARKHYCVTRSHFGSRSFSP